MKKIKYRMLFLFVLTVVLTGCRIYPNVSKEQIEEDIKNHCYYNNNDDAVEVSDVKIDHIDKFETEAIYYCSMHFEYPNVSKEVKATMVYGYHTNEDKWEILRVNELETISEQWHISGRWEGIVDPQLICRHWFERLYLDITDNADGTFYVVVGNNENGEVYYADDIDMDIDYIICLVIDGSEAYVRILDDKIQVGRSDCQVEFENLG